MRRGAYAARTWARGAKRSGAGTWYAAGRVVGQLSKREPRNLEVSVRQWISLVYTLAGELGAGGHLFGMPCGPPGIPWTMVAVEKTTVSVQKRSKATGTKQQRAPLTTRRPHRSKDPASRGAFAFSHDKVRALYTLSQPTVRADWTADWTARRMVPSNACLRFCQNIEHKSEGFLPSSQRQRSRLNTPLPDQVLSCI